MENETSLNIVAAVPLYNPKIPLVRISSNVKELAEIFRATFPSEEFLHLYNCNLIFTLI